MERSDDHWQARLPDTLLEHVVWPVRVESHHDDSVPAAQWRGYDALGLLCYYRHPFSQRDGALDDDDATTTVLLREEHFEAWRTLMGPWVRRIQRINGDGRGDGQVEEIGLHLVEPRAIPRL